MVKRVRATQRLSRERIIEVSIELLDGGGEEGLTFRALSERLATGPGAIYWHISNKGELISAACGEIVARTLDECAMGETHEESIRNLALGIFDAMDVHPWVGSVLASPEGQMVMVRILEPLGQQVCALGVPADTQWKVVGALLNYILGVGGRNAANGQLARERGLDRDDFLEGVAAMWSQLDSAEYPFARSITGMLRDHDDREDFLAGVDLILRGIGESGG